MSTAAFDLVIAGAGITGLAAAVQAAAGGLRTLLIERHTVGGRTLELSRLEITPGFPVGFTGRELIDRTTLQALRFGAELRTGTAVTRVKREGDAFAIETTNSMIHATSLLIATGSDVTLPAIPGLRDFIGRGANIVCASSTNASCTPAEIIGTERVEAVIYRNARTGRTRIRATDAIDVVATERPRADWIRDLVDTNEQGFITTDAEHRTRTTGLHAAGSVRTPGLQPLDAIVEGIRAARLLTAAWTG